MEFIEFYKNKEIFYDYKFIGIFLILMFEKLNSDKRFLFWFFCFMWRVGGYFCICILVYYFKSVFLCNGYNIYFFGYM